MRHPITCGQADRMRPALTPCSSITNYVGGEVLDWSLPPITLTLWLDADGREALLEELDEDGCRHWLLSREACQPRCACREEESE